MADCHPTINGTAISYDEIGNPLTYRDNMSFTWNGRQMATANLNGTAVTYKYDADGLRNYKKVGNTVHEYEYVGGQLVYEKRGDLKFYYRYNAMGELASIKRIDANGTETSVYVITNTRGDIEELRLASGTMVARYVYDTWGNTIGILDDEGDPITDTSSIAVQNPFRYRGYYYDAESGIYYLQSRYYDPVTGRFVNADDVATINDNLLSVSDKNLYAYCGNNPVIKGDDGGEWAHIVIGAVISGVFELGSQLLDNGGNFKDVNWKRVGIATAVGGITAGCSFGIGVAVSGVGNVAMDLASGEKNPKKIASNALKSVAESFVGAGASKIVKKIGGKIAVNALSKKSPGAIKETVTKCVKVAGKYRNSVKDLSWAVNKYKDLPEKLLGKAIPQFFDSMASGVFNFAIEGVEYGIE